MTVFYYHRFSTLFSNDAFEDRLKLLSEDQRAQIRRFRKPSDAYASLVGKLLLLKGFKAFQVSETLHDVKYTAHGKPYLDTGSLCFSISHSGRYVGCIISSDTASVGVDIEEIRPLNMEDFATIWSERERNEIAATNDLRIFYRYWTRKEAVVKADGKGLSIPLRNVDLQPARALLQERTYYLKEVDFRPDVMISVASLDPIDQLNATPVVAL